MMGITASQWLEQICERLGLEFSEFIVLWSDYGNFGTHGCEKETPHCKSEPDDVELSQDHKIVIQESPSNKEFVENEAGETGIGAKCELLRPHFEIVLKEHQKSRLTIRKELAEKAGLIGKRVVVLKYLEKKPHWPVLLDQRRNGGFRLELTTGWSKFRKANSLVSGNTYSFVFNGVENAIQVEPVHKK